LALMPQNEPGMVAARAWRFSDVSARSARWTGVSSSAPSSRGDGARARRTSVGVEVDLDALHPAAEDALEEGDLLLCVLPELWGGELCRVGLDRAGGEGRGVDGDEAAQEGGCGVGQGLGSPRLCRGPAWWRHRGSSRVGQRRAATGTRSTDFRLARRRRALARPKLGRDSEQV